MTIEEELARLREQLRETRAQLVQSEKLAALGALTAGVAHELNNPIGFVKNNAVMLGEYLDVLVPVLREVLSWTQEPEGKAALGERIAAASRGEDLHAILDDIEPLLMDTQEGAARLEDIVGGLRRFARTDSAEGESFDLNQCVRDALKVAWNELKYKAKVTEDLAELPALHGQPGAMNQVVLNLLVNAAQAMGSFGEIRIATRPAAGGVELCVADSGRGIADEDLTRIFTPFFTTKPAGKGTGLGLPISREIVEGHGGTIQVTSTLGSGTEFRVTLPIASESRDGD